MYRVILDEIEEREDAEFLALLIGGAADENRIAARKPRVVEVFDPGPLSLGKDQVVEALGSVRKHLCTCADRDYLPAFSWVDGLLQQCEDAVKKSWEETA